jgi:Tfp pilus assembly major pilin PilA
VTLIFDDFPHTPTESLDAPIIRTASDPQIARASSLWFAYSPVRRQETGTATTTKIPPNDTKIVTRTCNDSTAQNRTNRCRDKPVNGKCIDI